MRALRFHGPGNLQIDDIPMPECRAGWVRIKVSWCGICGTDLHEYANGPRLVPTTPHPVTGEVLPCTLGHELSGTVVQVGEEVTDFKAGDQVIVESILYDNSCYACSQQAPGLCQNRVFVGYSGYGGGFADYICSQQESVHKLPNTISMEVGALIEPLAVAWRRVKVSKIKKGQSALIIGGGPIGLAVLLCLLAHDVKNIIISEVSTTRPGFTTLFGATTTINPLAEDVVARSFELCEGRGPDVIFDYASVQQSADTSFAAVRVKGTIINLAMWKAKPTINVNLFLSKQFAWIGSSAYSQGDFQDVINAVVSGSIKKPERLITSKIGLNDAITLGFHKLANRNDTDVKILITPEETIS